MPPRLQAKLVERLSRLLRAAPAIDRPREAAYVETEEVAWSGPSPY